MLNTNSIIKYYTFWNGRRYQIELFTNVFVEVLEMKLLELKLLEFTYKY